MNRYSWVEDTLLISFLGVVYGGVFWLFWSPIAGVIIGTIAALSLLIWLRAHAIKFVNYETTSVSDVGGPEQKSEDTSRPARKNAS